MHLCKDVFIFKGQLNVDNMRWHLLFLLIGCSHSLSAQILEDYTLSNPVPIDSFRYSDVEGSPYLFRDWPEGEVLKNNGTTYRNVVLNINGYSGSVEIRKDGEYIDLDETRYLRIAVPQADGDSAYFYRGLIPQEPLRFAQLLYNGQRYRLFRDFVVTMNEVKNDLVGNIVVYRKFMPKFVYYLMHDGQLTPLRLRKKYLLNLIGQEQEVEVFLRREKLDIETEEGLSRVLAHLDTKS